MEPDFLYIKLYEAFALSGNLVATGHGFSFNGTGSYDWR